MTLRAVCYPRVSSATQREADSIAAQLRDLPAYVERQGWTLVRPVDAYIDNGFSATKRLDRRLGFNALLRDAAAGLFDVVVVMDVDRLTRTGDLRERGLILGAFQATGVKVASVIGGQVLDFSTEWGELSGTLQAIFAAQAAKKIGERSKQAKVTSVSRNRLPSGRTPFGLSYDKESGGWSIDLVRGPIVVEIFERLAAGDTCHAIARDFEARELPRTVNKTGGEVPGVWTRQRVWDIATATYVTGRWVAHKASRGIVAVPALITADLYQRALDALAKRQKLGLDQRTKHVYLLEAMARCGFCGGRIVIRWSGRRLNQSFYVCKNRREPDRRSQPCAAPIVPTAALDARAWEQLCAKVAEPGLAGELAYRRGERSAESHDWAADVAEYRAKLARLEVKQEGLIERWKRDLISEDTLDASLATLRREAAALQAQVAAAERAIVALETAEERLANATAVIERLLARMPYAKPADRRELVRALVDAETVIFERDGAITFDVLLPRAPSRVGSGDGSSSEHPDTGAHAQPLRLRVVA